MKDVLIGNTPVVRLSDTNIYVKLEKYNAGGSIKDRAVLGMLLDGIEKGLVSKDSILIEATSGNTGIALAMLGAVYGYKVVIVMPETMSVERRALVRAYGAELILSEGLQRNRPASSRTSSRKARHQRRVRGSSMVYPLCR